MNTDENTLNYQYIEQAILYFEKNFPNQPELDQITEKVHLRSVRFHHLFTEWAGISPKHFLQFLTVGFLKKKLKSTKNKIVADLLEPSQAYNLLTTLKGITPQEYKIHRSGIHIDYGFHNTPFGIALIGVAERGICWLSFLSTNEAPNTALEKMKAHWHNATLHQCQESTHVYIDSIFYTTNSEKRQLHVFVKGTDFQIKVWNALLRLPLGEVTTYQNIAQQINRPKAMQAVGSAVGSNHIAYLIPCHRVIRKDGILGEYRWDVTRKKSIIGWEMAKSIN